MLLIASFSNLNLGKESLQVIESMLDDITARQFKLGIEDLIQNEANIFPGTNIVALIREYCLKHESLAENMRKWHEREARQEKENNTERKINGQT